jgi:glycosyltransferase involved in cell wall biosynthesis
MKLLYINTYDPFEEKHGGAAVARAELDALKTTFDVDTLFGSPMRLRKTKIHYGRLLVDVLAGRSLKYASYNVLHRPLDSYRPYDLIWCSHDFSAYDYRIFVQLGIPFVVRKQNAEHRFFDGQIGWRRYERNRLLAFEKHVNSIAQATLHISSTEYSIDNYSRSKFYLPPPLGAKNPGAHVPHPYVFSERSIDLLCVTNFDWAPNREGIEWFISKVLPRLSSDVSVHLVGLGSERYASDDRIISHGFAPELTSYYASAKVFLSPVLSGAGIKIKTVSALSEGLPLVSTSIGVEGLPNINDLGVALVADSAEEFSEHIKRLLHDSSECSAMSERARQWANENVMTPSAWLNEVTRILHNTRRGVHQCR